MNQIIKSQENKEVSDFSKIERVLIQGNLAELKPEERVQYYNKVCESVGLNPLTKPFDYITLQGKLQLYTRKDACDQLRRIYKVSIQIVSRETMEGIFTVTARALLPDGRSDEDSGSICISGLKGNDLANAIMKATTKAKRRATLSICGLGFVDESEIETIPQHEKGIRVIPEQPKEEDGAKGFIEEYIIPGGTWAKRKLREIDPKELQDYIIRIEERVKKSPSKKAEWWDDFVVRAEGYLGELENSPLELSEEPSWEDELEPLGIVK